MTRRAEVRAEQRSGAKQVDNDLVTAQILAGFQYKEPPRPKTAGCTEDCPTEAPNSCLKECEIPCTADCTDACVVVCEAPHRLDDDLCCDFQDACDNQDCQYSYLDESCCFGCDPNAFPLLHEQPHGSASSGGFGLSTLPLYQQQHDFSVYQHGFHAGCLHARHLNYRPMCYDNVMPQCTMACPGSSTDNYEGSPIPSLMTADSPWSLQSSISGPSVPQYTPLPPAEPENPPNVLTSYSADNMNLFSSSDSIPSPTNVRIKPHGVNSLSDASGFDMMTDGSHFSRGQLTDISGDTDFGSMDNLARPTGDQEPKLESAPLQCRWVVSDSGGPNLCGLNFGSREDLHKHIIEEHVKSMKKRGLSTNSLHPICCWHGCESARKKKVFKLQHLKDHIVCHSKLRMKCEVCGKECRDAKVLKLHMNTHRPGQEKPFRCDFEGCTASFGTSALLSSHKRVHTGEKPHQCAWCEYRAADKGNLRRHEEEMHMGKKWPCPYCNQKLAKKANLTRHISKSQSVVACASNS